MYDNLKQDKTKRDFTIGIVDHVAFTSLPVTREIKTAPAGQTSAEFWACHIPSYARQYDMVSSLKQGGIFLLNCSWAPADLERELPASMKRALAVKEARLYAIDATRIARGLGLGGRTNTILQAA